MQMKAAKKTKKSLWSKAPLWIAFVLIIGTFVWVVYAFYFRSSWNTIESEGASVVENNGEEDSDGTDISSEEEEVSLESSLYSEKFDAALVELGGMEVTDYLVVVDISEQKEYLFTNEGEFVDMYRIATGATSVYAGTEVNADGVSVPVYENRAMGVSVWRVSVKRDYNLEPLYGPRLMWLEKRVGNGWMETEVALHGTNTPEILGTPSSLGCIYHENADIIELYELLDVGTLVVAIE